MKPVETFSVEVRLLLTAGYYKLWLNIFDKDVSESTGEMFCNWLEENLKRENSTKYFVTGGSYYARVMELIEFVS